jgi:hypothetical protein
MSDGDALRGLEFSWYWIDESRDTPLNTHDIILSRLREGPYVKGLITTTPNAEDWVWNRFIKNGNPPIFGYSHTRTIESVRHGIITQEFYDAMRQAYSPAMAAQELDAEHIVVLDGRAYYAMHEENRKRGYFEPNPDLAIVVGCDFNYAPAPMVWVIGQVSDDGESIHWFDEISNKETSSAQQARELGNKYGNFFLQLYGDASGNRGTTSNQGQTDFIQIGNELSEMGVAFSIDTDQMNPAVRDRVENTNRLLCDADNNVRMTYNPDFCTLLDADMKKVVWKNGKLSGNGDVNLTHASDACGYALWKIFPPTAMNLRMAQKVASKYSHLRE